jgi:hypothetical protein
LGIAGNLDIAASRKKASEAMALSQQRFPQAGNNNNA